MPEVTDRSAVRSMSQALEALGVTRDTLTDDEKAAYDRDGYIVFPSLVDRDTAARMASVLDEIAGIEGDKAGTDFHTEAGTTRLGNLMNKNPIFDICFLHPKVLAALDYATHGDFGVSSLTGRAALPGEGAQPLHVDFPADANGIPRPRRAANALWAIDDFTAENGPTRIIRGSHRYGRVPGVENETPGPLPDEVALIVPAGSCAVVDGATWHAGSRNNTDRTRHILSVMCQPRDEYQEWAYRKLSPATAARFSDAAMFILDHRIAE